MAPDFISFLPTVLLKLDPSQWEEGFKTYVPAAEDIDHADWPVESASSVVIQPNQAVPKRFLLVVQERRLPYIRRASRATSLKGLMVALTASRSQGDGQRISGRSFLA